MCDVGGSKYETYHKMEGRWNGTISVMGNVMIVIKKQNLVDQGSVSSVTQVFESKGYWMERRSLTHQDGVTSVQEIKFTPLSSGILKVSK